MIACPPPVVASRPLASAADTAPAGSAPAVEVQAPAAGLAGLGDTDAADGDADGSAEGEGEDWALNWPAIRGEADGEAELEGLGAGDPPALAFGEGVEAHVVVALGVLGAAAAAGTAPAIESAKPKAPSSAGTRPVDAFNVNFTGTPSAANGRANHRKLATKTRWSGVCDRS